LKARTASDLLAVDDQQLAIALAVDEIVEV